MTNRLYRAANQALSVCLLASILATGYLAVTLTRVSASVTVTFGTQPKQFAEALSTRDLVQFYPAIRPGPDDTAYIRKAALAALPVPSAIPARKPGVPKP